MAASSSPGLTMATKAEMDSAYTEAKAFFATGATKPIAWRVKQLRTLRRMLEAKGEVIERAIISDMRRSE